MDVEPVVVVDYATWSEDFEGADIACKASPKGLKCRSRAGDMGGSVWTAFGPTVKESVAGLRTIDFEFTAHTGPTSGIAWGIAGGRWTGVLLSNDPASMGAAWFGAWDGAKWVPYRDWGEPIVEKGWGPHTLHVEFRDDGTVEVSIDGIVYSRMRPSVPAGGAIAPVMMGFTRTDFRRLALGGGVVRQDTPPPPRPVPPAPVAAPAPSAGMKPLPGKWEWMSLGGELPSPLYEGSNLVAAEGDTLIIQNSAWGTGDTPTITTYASAGCGRGAWTPITPTPSQTAALEASREEWRRGKELAKDPRFGGQEAWFHWEGSNVYGVQGETLYASFDGGATWSAAQTIGLEPVPRFGQLVGCGTGLVFVPEVPAVWESMKPTP